MLFCYSLLLLLVLFNKNLLLFLELSFNFRFELPDFLNLIVKLGMLGLFLLLKSFQLLLRFSELSLQSINFYLQVLRAI